MAHRRASAETVVWTSPFHRIFCKVVRLPSVSPRLLLAVPCGVTTMPNRCLLIDVSPANLHPWLPEPSSRRGPVGDSWLALVGLGHVQTPIACRETATPQSNFPEAVRSPGPHAPKNQ